ncbi:COL6A [Mytilus coruscus]|uniref:COL6A n=1 Tax=Mytilus coruscus TaxID=42192 RepID=A0A6J8C181_MYTCO|nr:COL6A [Mytilus coruscus]
MENLMICLLVILSGVLGAPKMNLDGPLQSKCNDGKPADVFFLLDSSSSIWQVDYKIQLQFISDVIDMFTIAPNHTRVAVSAFSHFYRPFIRFDSSIPFGSTYTGDALKKIRTRGFKNARPGVAHIGVVLTDGASANKEKTKEEAEKLKSQGVYLFAIGVGNKFDMNELIDIGSKPSEDFVYDVDKYNMLDSIRETLAIKACTVESITEAPLPLMDQPACGLKGIADMMFCFDSAATGTARSKIVYNFITEITDEFNMNDGDGIRVGIMSRNCHEHDIHLNDYIQKDELMGAINSIEFQGMGPILHNMRKHGFKESHGGRTEARKIAVLFVDEETEKLDFVFEEAAEAKSQGIEVYVVSIGNVDVNVLRKIASEPVGSHVIKVSSYDDVPLLKDDFVNSVCEDL